jgi:SAM-dependent methyltransferase
MGSVSKGFDSPGRVFLRAFSASVRGKIQPPVGITYRSDVTAVAEALYSREELAFLPTETVELALGVANPLRHAGLRGGEAVLDLGCGAGIDTLLAARAVGPRGLAIGVDMTPEMVKRAPSSGPRRRISSFPAAASEGGRFTLSPAGRIIRR